MSGWFTTFMNCRLCVNGELVEDQFVVSDDSGLILPRTGYIGGDAVDLEEGIIAPGFLELQTNGLLGFHFTHFRDEVQYGHEVDKISEYFVSQGVTAFWATIPTVSSDDFKKILPSLKPRTLDGCASLLGAHAEGPYLHASKRGCHNAALFVEPSTPPASVYGPSGSNSDVLKLVTLAPELPHSTSLINDLTSLGIKVSLGHSAASYGQGLDAVRAGATCLTHTMNAMTPIHHRDPGLAGLAATASADRLESPYFSIITDGHHLHPSIATLLFRANPDKCIVITDSIEVAGLPDGIHPGHAQIAHKQRKTGSKVTIEGTDTLVGGCASLQECVRNLMKWSGCNVAQAVKCVTENVANFMGDETRGKLEAGRRADFVVLSDEGEVLQTWVAGLKLLSMLPCVSLRQTAGNPGSARPTRGYGSAWLVESVKRVSGGSCMPNAVHVQGVLPADPRHRSVTASARKINKKPGIGNRRKSTNSSQPHYIPGRNCNSWSAAASRHSHQAPTAEVLPLTDGTRSMEGQEQRAEDEKEPENESDAFEDAPDTTASIVPQPIIADPIDRPATPPPIEPAKSDSPQDKHEHGEQTIQEEPRANAPGDGTTDPLDTTPTLTHASIPHLPPPVPARESTPSPMTGFSGDLPVVNYPPPPSVNDKSLPVPATATQTPNTRKVSSPFSWLSRATSRKTSSSPPRQPALPNRRGTASSLNTLGSNGDGPLARTDEERDGRRTGRPHRSSLKDRFHMVRLQEEASIADEATGLANGEGVDATSLSLEKGQAQSPPPILRTASSSSLPAGVKSVNSKLAPGTASGISVGPSAEDEAPVNWDLWQNLVNDGPAALARSSGEEMSKAIASGIPQPIRGVVWQVLAESKSEDLEAMYRELVARSADTDVNHAPPMFRTGSSSNVNGAGEMERLASSASSQHSDTSTPTTSAANGPTSPIVSRTNSNIDGMAAQAAMAAEKKRSKEDAVALQKLEKTIRRDLGARTSYSKYLASAGLQDGLYGICKAYALYDGDVGYAQGMNFIAMPLLFNMPEEEAFTLFVRLMSKYNLRSLFTAEMTGLHLHLYLFERLLEDSEPALYCHLHRRGVTPVLYATQWFLTLFAYRFPLQLVLRIYDLILSEGLTAILKFGIVLMQKNATTLLGMRDMSQLTTHLKEKLFDVYIDKTPSASSLLESGFFGSTSGIDKEVYRADALVRDACAIVITPETLALYTAEYEETARTERERELELETLRATNTALSAKVRALEERTQQSDTEHVGIASDLVRTKVDNEGLRDENESLATQLVELRKMVETQPAEVEARLRGEMERIMQRNIEVQNQNRALEENMEEMERELVGTKMGFAQVNGEHDALKQKLSNIQAMLSAA